MKYELSCHDLGMDDDFVVHGNKKASVLRKMVKHAKEAHRMSEEQLNTPKMRKVLRESVHRPY